MAVALVDGQIEFLHADQRGHLRQCGEQLEHLVEVAGAGGLQAEFFVGRVGVACARAEEAETFRLDPGRFEALVDGFFEA